MCHTLLSVAHLCVCVCVCVCVCCSDCTECPADCVCVRKNRVQLSHLEQKEAGPHLQRGNQMRGRERENAAVRHFQFHIPSLSQNTHLKKRGMRGREVELDGQTQLRFRQR